MNTNESALPKKFRVAVVSSDCGGSQVAAEVVHAAVLKRFPGAESSLFFIDDLWPGRVICGFDWYLSLARFEYYRVIRCLIHLEKRIFGLMHKRFVTGLSNKLFFEDEEPDVIISTIPFINPALFQLSKERNIPVFVVATDMDSELYSFEWPSGEELPPHRFGVFCDHHEVLSQVNAAVDPSKLVFTGGFVKEEFTRCYSEVEQRAFRKKLSLPCDRDVISLMMGSLGGRQIGDYVLRILEAADKGEFLGEPHFVILCGKNTSLEQKLKKLLERRGYKKNRNGFFERPFGGISFSILGYTDQIYKYYALSRGLITKPGGGSVHEALAQNLPLIIDKVNGQLPWEQLTSKITSEHGAGVVIDDLKDLPRLINTHFIDSKGNNEIRARVLRFKSEQSDPCLFSRKIGDTVETLLVESTHC